MNCCSTVSKGLSFLDTIPDKLVVLGQFCINCLILGIKRQLCSRCLTGMSEKLSTCYPKRGDAKETFCIFIWKISQGFVRLCFAFPAKFKERPVSRYSSLDKTMPSPVVNAREALIKVKGAHLFNLIPCELLGMSGVTAETFKAHLNEWLSTILDEPTIPG